MSQRHRLVLDIVATDRTFDRATGRMGEIWLGKCIHCNAPLQVKLDGDLPRGVTLEHILPRSHGGTDDLQNVALACARCNHHKGTRLDHLLPGDARLMDVVENLLSRRRKRWRDRPDQKPL